jgi:hypothetical protein
MTNEINVVGQFFRLAAAIRGEVTRRSAATRDEVFAAVGCMFPRPVFEAAANLLVAADAVRGCEHYLIARSK